MNIWRVDKFNDRVSRWGLKYLIVVVSLFSRVRYFYDLSSLVGNHSKFAWISKIF